MQPIGNFYSVRCEQAADGENFIRLPDALLKSIFWQIGDEIEWQPCRSSGAWAAVNMSVQVLYASRFLRNYRSLSKALTNPRHPLQRVGIKCYPSNQVSLVMVPASALQTLHLETNDGDG